MAPPTMLSTTTVMTRATIGKARISTAAAPGTGRSSVLTSAAACAVSGVGAATPYLLFAAASGILSPPAGPVMRGIWAALTPDEIGRSRAYGLDAVAEEGLFAIGSLLVGAVLLVASPVAALAITAGLGLAGASTLGQPRAAAAVCIPVHLPSGRSLLGPLLLPGVRWVATAMLAVGFALAPLEVGVIARATQAGSPAAAGYLLAVLSVGSAAGGLLWGRLRRPPTSGLFLAVMAVFGAGTAVAGPSRLCRGSPSCSRSPGRRSPPRSSLPTS
jgi:hypothetical protein